MYTCTWVHMRTVKSVEQSLSLIVLFSLKCTAFKQIQKK